MFVCSVISSKSTQVNDMYKIGVEATTKYFAVKPGKEEKNSTFNKLDYYVNTLMARGVKVVFFELPVSCEITKSPLHKAVRETFFSKYAPGKFVYIATPDCSDYKTSDGIHFADVYILLVP